MDHRFQIDLRGLIDLLSHHLYTSSDVFLRELLQNAVDAHTALRLLGREVTGRVRVRAMGDGRLIMEDDGVGLTEDEVHGFLATIGQSSKRLGSAEEARDFLGQFGIGLLACFVVSDDIEVRTRSAKSDDAPVLRWRGRSDGTYTLERIEETMGHGTRVELRAKAGRADSFEPARVRKGLSHYGALLPRPIELETPQGNVRIDAPVPWRVAYESPSARREAILAYGQQLFDVKFLDCIPLASREGGVDGVAFVLPHASVTAARRADRVYLKGMLLSDKADNLLPGWAFFTKAVVDVHGLRPLASREGFFEDSNLESAREALGQCIKDYLGDLARAHPDALHRLIALHHEPLKQLAVEDSEFIRWIAKWLPFVTSAGTMTLEDYLRRSPVPRYARTIDEFRQVAPFVEAQGGCVINAGYIHDYDLLERLAAQQIVPEPERVDASSLADDFAELEMSEREEVFALLRTADLVLQPFRCQARVKRFAPSSLPALFVAGDDAAFIRAIERSREATSELWSAVLDDVAADRRRSSFAQLLLNYGNPMIRRLARVEDPELLRRLIEVLYVQTLLLGHHPLSAAEMSLVSESLTGLMAWSLDTPSVLQ